MPYLLHTLVDADDQAHPQDSLDAMIAGLRSDTGATACLVANKPTEEELHRLAEEFQLHPLAVEDAFRGHQRPKLERYDEALFLAVHPIQYTDQTEKLTLSEVHTFVGPNYFLVTVNDDQTARAVAHQLERAFRRPHLEPHNPQTLLYFVLDGIVDEYEPVLMNLDEDLDDIEDQLFTGQNTSQRIYELFNEVVKFQRATRPLGYMVDRLMRGEEKYETPPPLRTHLRDVKDHVIRAVEHLDSLRSALQNALTVESTLVGQRQNDAMKKMSAWAGILIVPTIIAGIYGMNFEKMPELAWPWGYYYALGLMVVVCSALWLIFKKKSWL